METTPQWATGVQILRDGVPLGNPLAIVPGASEMSFDDTTVTKGAHTYALKTQYEYYFESSLPHPMPTVSKPGQSNLDTLDRQHTPMKLEKRHFDSALTPDQALYLEGDPMLVGTGISDITGPIAEVVMMGYANSDQVSSGLHMRLYARAFVFANPNNDRQRVVFVSAELGQLFSSIKQGVIKNLMQRYGGLYDDRNVQIAATHTHAGPGGYSHHAIFNFTSFGHVLQNYTAIVDGITEAIIQAHDRLAPATLSVADSHIDEKTSVNRSEIAFKLNCEFKPDCELYEQVPPLEINPEVTMLRINRPDRPVGVISWFSVHNTSLTNKNTLVSSDHKGWASYQFEKLHDSIIAPLHPGKFVAAFPNGDEGDLSPNIEEGFHGPGYHIGKDQFSSMQIIGDREFNTANRLFHSMRRTPVDGGVDFRHMFVEMPGYVVTSAGQVGNTLCRGAYGMSFAAGAEDGPTNSEIFHEGMTVSSLSTTVTDLQNKYANIIKTGIDNRNPIPITLDLIGNTMDLVAPLFLRGIEGFITSDPCQAPKPVLIPSGQLGLTPEVLPFQLLRVGSVVIVGIPGEMTTQSGRRLRAHILNSLSSIGVNRVILTGLANEYSGYITTPEEYDSQQYEGASTMFGRLTLDAYLQIFGQLADAMATGQPVPTGPKPDDLGGRQIELQTPVIYDDKRLVEQFGQVMAEPAERVSPGHTVQALFRAGHPKNDLKRNDTYLLVERNTGSDDAWEPVAWDAMPETRIIWLRDTAADCLACSFISAQWEVPPNAIPGTYRIRHFGAWKSGLDGKIRTYDGTTRNFAVQ
ncbi:MAG: neutral/alkaline ceramidase [Nitrosomonas sp.]|nr:neutral/alkaline ceramidase [Nitrosomonas sp.]